MSNEATARQERLAAARDAWIEDLRQRYPAELYSAERLLEKYNDVYRHQGRLFALGEDIEKGHVHSPSGAPAEAYFAWSGELAAKLADYEAAISDRSPGDWAWQQRDSSWFHHADTVLERMADGDPAVTITTNWSSADQFNYAADRSLAERLGPFLQEENAQRHGGGHTTAEQLDVRRDSIGDRMQAACIDDEPDEAAPEEPDAPIWKNEARAVAFWCRFDELTAEAAGDPFPDDYSI